MFDIGFSELVVIAVVALVVIGPERLPTVARTVGALLGRLNRYVSDVKSDVEREMRLEEMKKLRAEVEAQASGIEQQVVRELEETRSASAAPLAEVGKTLEQVAGEAGRAMDQSAFENGAASAIPEADPAPSKMDSAALPAADTAKS